MQQPEIATQLIACGLPVFPCWDNKQPAIGGGFKSATTTPGNYWPSPLVGVPIPQGVVVIDVDVHKGMTTALIDQVLGCQLDWVGSLLQFTPSGGGHYAFSTTETMRQGSDLFEDRIGKGFDTRVTGRGYICTGGTYGSDDPIGVLKLAAPTSLPPLPLKAIQVLTAQVTAQHQPAPLPTGDRNADEVRKMLRCLVADCGRSEWRDTALALKHHYHDDDGTGWVLFDNWSMTGGDAYDPIESRKLWNTINPTTNDGRASITLATVAHKAIEKGYVPSSIAAELFGSGITEDSAELSTVETLIARINADGGNPKRTDELTGAIRSLTCNTIQRAALAATLKRTLKEHNLPIPAKTIDQACTPLSLTALIIPQPVAQNTHLSGIRVAPVMGMTGDHRCNAEMLRDAVFGDRLTRYDGDLYWWTGSYWERPAKADVNAAISAAFSTTGAGKTSNIDGTHKQIGNVSRRLPDMAPTNEKIFFKNGVFDPRSPHLGVVPHAAENLNTFVLGVDYTPGALHPEWDKFLESIFYKEPERKILLQEVMGWVLISSNLNIQKAIALDGSSRGGKGTIIDILGSILGSGMTTITFGELHAKQTLYDMRSAQLAVDTDATRPERNNAAAVHTRFNRITANEPIDIKINYQDGLWSGRLNCKMIAACNGIPVIADDSSAAPRRWVILKFTEDFTDREDLNLGLRLVPETAAIAAWAVEGLRRLMVNKRFSLPDSSKMSVKELSESSSPLVLFANERITFGEGETVQSRLLWEAYRSWCSDNNSKNYLTMYNFGRLFKQLMIERGAEYAEKIPDANGARFRGYRGAALVICTEGTNVTPIGRAFKEAPQ